MERELRASCGDSHRSVMTCCLDPLSFQKALKSFAEAVEEESIEMRMTTVQSVMKDITKIKIITDLRMESRFLSANFVQQGTMLQKF